MQRARLPYLIIPLAAFLAIIPLLIHGCSCGHDFDFHLLSWMEAARQFTHGNLHPHWAYTPAYNAGEPRFTFYPPLSWTIGAILGLLFPWTWTPILFTWLALTASGLALHRLARDFTTPTAALIAATLYTVNPYMLFTAYERTAYAELLAAAFIPLLLQAILRSNERGGVTVPRIAIPIALLWLTNAPAAVMSCYALALLTAIRLATNSSTRFPPVASNDLSPKELGAPHLDSEMWDNRAEARSVLHSKNRKSPGAPSFAPRRVGKNTLQLAINTTAGTILGLGLAAFYILPAAYERRYVQIAMAIIPDMRIQDNFLFHHTGDALHDQVLHTASLIALAMITTTAILLLALFVNNKAQVPHPLQSHRKPGPPTSAFARRGGEGWDVQIPPNILLQLTVLTITITLLLTPLTTILWNHAPELVFLQFPWRLTAILAAILALTIALALTPLNLKPTPTAALILVLAAAFTYPAYNLFHQTCDEEDTVQARLALFQSNQGTDPTDEYTPTTADNDSLQHNDPPYWLAPNPEDTATATAPIYQCSENCPGTSIASPGPAPTHFTVNPATPANLILDLRDYPAWRITLNGTTITNHIQRDDGLIALPIPGGPSTIDIHYAQTRDQTLGDIVSLISLALLALFLSRRRTKSRNKIVSAL